MRRKMTIAACGFACALLAAVLLADAFLSHAFAQDDEQERRARLDTLTATEKDELRRKREQFQQLDKDHQQRMRRLHAAIAASPDRARLEELLLRYHEWLKSLSQQERAELLSLPEDKRVEEIKRLMQEQRQRRFAESVKTKLKPEDVRGIFAWLDEYVQQHEAQLLATLPQPMRERITRANIPDSLRRKGILMALGQRREDAQLPTPSDEELARLNDRLSLPAQQALKQISNPEQKLALVREWVRAAFASRFVAQVSNERLLRFYRDNRDSMEPAKREELERMPPEQFYGTLRRLYMQRGPWRRRFDGQHHQGRPPHWKRDDRPRREEDRPPAGGPFRDRESDRPNNRSDVRRQT